MVGIGDRGIDADHVGLERQRGIDAGRAGMVRHAHADPGDAAFARQLDGGFQRAGHDQMAHAVVAVDQRGRRRGALDLDVGTRIGRAELEPLTYCGRRNTPCASAPVRSASSISSATLAASAAGSAGLQHGIGDQAGDGGGRDAAGLGVGLHVHAFHLQQLLGAAAEDRGLVGVGNFQPAHMRDAIQHRHVVGVIAAEHDAVGADQADHGFERRRRNAGWCRNRIAWRCPRGCCLTFFFGSGRTVQPCSQRAAW